MKSNRDFVWLKDVEQSILIICFLLKNCIICWMHLSSQQIMCAMLIKEGILKGSIIKAALLQQHVCDALNCCLCTQAHKVLEQSVSNMFACLVLQCDEPFIREKLLFPIISFRIKHISKMKTAYVATIIWCKLHLTNRHYSLITFMQITSSTQETHYGTPDPHYWKNNRLDHSGYPSSLTHARAKLKHC